LDKIVAGFWPASRCGEGLKILSAAMDYFFSEPSCCLANLMGLIRSIEEELWMMHQL